MPDVPDKLEAALDKPSYQPGETAKLFVKAPFAGQAELAIASDRILAMRSIACRRRAPRSRSRSMPAGAAASMRWSAPIGRPLLPAPQPRGPGRAVGVAWLGIDPAPRTLARGAGRARCGAAARPGRDSGQGGRARRRRGGLCHARRGRRGGAETDRVRQPGAREILLRQAPARRRIARPLRPADRSARRRASACCAAAATSSPNARSPACPTRAAGSSRCSPASSGWTPTAPPRVHFDIPDFQGQLRLMAVALSARTRSARRRRR